MPRSTPFNKYPILRLIRNIMRESGIERPNILDLGIGHGTFGMLIKTFVAPQAGITGVEVWKEYRCRRWKYYDTVITEDIREYVRRDDLSFDIVLLIDVLEHFSKEDGEFVISRIQKIARHLTIISTPTSAFEQGAAKGNPHERHVHIWKTPELEARGFVRSFHIYLPIPHKIPPYYELGVFAWRPH